VKRISILLIGATMVLLSACNNPHIGLAEQESVDATELKSFCDSKKFVTTETKKADSLVAVGKTAIDGGKTTNGYIALGEASSLYRIAISKYNGNKADKKIGSLEKDLQTDKDALSEYGDLLSEVKKQQSVTPTPVVTPKEEKLDSKEVSNVE
jgi:hypothetical protein